MALRRGDAIRPRFSAAGVALLLAVAAWPAWGSSVPSRFVPDEIIVKFRAVAPDLNSGNENIPAVKSRQQLYLQAHGSGFRVREIKPIVRDFDRWREALRDADPSNLTQKEKRLLQRQRRTAASNRHVDLTNIYRIRLNLDGGEGLAAALEAYRSRPDVEYAELNPIISVCVAPNDPLYADQWALTKIHAAEAWDTCRGSNDVIIAVIDTGVDYNQPDLQGNVWINETERQGLAGVDDDHNGYIDDVRGWNFAYSNNDPIDDHGHGTHCAGIIAAIGNNGTGIAGVCWSARIMPIKILDSTGQGSAADAVPAIYYAVANGADIISGSWGGTDEFTALHDAIAYAHDQGVVIVAAAGNADSNTPYYPAAYPEVISVAATDTADHRWYLSNYGTWVLIAAPGQSIVSLLATLPGATANPGASSIRSGTSMAAPHVSGTCALLLAANPLLHCAELPQILTSTADPIPPGTCSSNGRLNVYNALRAVIPAGGTIRLDQSSYMDGADIGLLVADWQLRGSGHGTVLVETSGGDKETVTVRETNVSLGVLRGVITSKNAPVIIGDGILQVHHGESIQARYLAIGDGSGQAGQWRSVSAVADYEPPTVVSVKTTLLRTTGTVELQTSEPTRAEVRYGRTQGGPYSSVQKDPGFSTQHSIPLTGLTSPVQYWFVVALTDEAGNQAMDDNHGQGYLLTAQSTTP